MLIRKWFGLSVGLFWWSALCACKASILTGRARRGLFETSQNLVAEHLLSVSAPVATYLVVLGARSTACFCRVFSELRMPIFCHHTPPSSYSRSPHPPLIPSSRKFCRLAFSVESVKEFDLGEFGLLSCSFAAIVPSKLQSCRLLIISKHP